MVDHNDRHVGLSYSLAAKILRCLAGFCSQVCGIILLAEFFAIDNVLNSVPKVFKT